MVASLEPKIVLEDLHVGISGIFTLTILENMNRKTFDSLRSRSVSQLVMLLFFRNSEGLTMTQLKFIFAVL